MILGNRAIHRVIEERRLSISPFEQGQVTESSVDLHLGDRGLIWYKRQASFNVTRRPPTPAAIPMTRSPACLIPVDTVPVYDDSDAIVERVPGYVLYPDCFYLASTLEEVAIGEGLCGELTGKSSLGRLGLKVHLTAGHVERGFKGNITLEIEVNNRIEIPVGWPICQLLLFEVLDGSDYSTRGSYRGASAQGPQPSRSYTHKRRHV